MFCLLVVVAWLYPFSYTPPHKARMLASDKKSVSSEIIAFFQSAKVQFLYSLAQASLLLFIFLEQLLCQRSSSNSSSFNETYIY